MKRIIVLIVLILSTSVVMAQFGNLKDIIKKEGHSSDSTTNKPDAPDIKQVESFALVEKALQDGFFCIKQDFQLEDTVTGKRYNYGDNQKRFGGQTSFMVLLDKGVVLPDEILHPWDYDENYPDYKNRQYIPVVSRTFLLKTGQKDWKMSETEFLPKREGSLANGLQYASAEHSFGKGLKRATGYGKKEVWVVWLLSSVDETASETTCQFLTEKKELTIEKDNKLYKIEQPNTPMSILGGIVVEPVVGGVGTIDLTLVGVVSQCDTEYKMATVIQSESEVGSGGLTQDD